MTRPRLLDLSRSCQWTGCKTVGYKLQTLIKNWY